MLVRYIQGLVLEKVCNDIGHGEMRSTSWYVVGVREVWKHGVDCDSLRCSLARPVSEVWRSQIERLLAVVKVAGLLWLVINVMGGSPRSPQSYGGGCYGRLELSMLQIEVRGRYS